MENLENDLLKTERRELCRLHALRLSGIEARLSKIDVSLNGNGKPETGLVWIVTRNNATLSWIGKIVLGILAIVLSNVVLKLMPEICRILATGKF